MSILEKAMLAIEAQQPKERTAVWMVGEQLKDMLRAEPHLAEIVEQDLGVKEMSLANCEKKIKAFSDKNKPKGANCFCVSPAESDRIIREFYGLPARDPLSQPVAASSPARGEPGGGIIDLSAFF